MTLVLLGCWAWDLPRANPPTTPPAAARPRRLAGRKPTSIRAGRRPTTPSARSPTRRSTGAVPKLDGAEMVNDDEICMQCHEAYVKSFHDERPPRAELRSLPRAGQPARGDPRQGAGADLQLQEGRRSGGPGRGLLEVPRAEPVRGRRPVADLQARPLRRDLRRLPPRPLQRARRHARHHACHERQASFAAVARRATLVSYNAAEAAKKDLPSLRGTSHHLGAMAPDLCLKCHCDMRDLLRIAGPHQIGGPNGFNCTTCHDPHGQIRESTRKDLCLSCHKGASHDGLARLDPRALRRGLHRLPQPAPARQRAAGRQHQPLSAWSSPSAWPCRSRSRRPATSATRRYSPMNHLPSHHPIMEGKMVCSDCHDPHGQLEKNLKAETINLLCYKCHAEKQGPFAYPHPPVNENCCICHEPHGTVANNLLRQPPTFLCLRCHTGHRDLDHGGHPHYAERRHDRTAGHSGTTQPRRLPREPRLEPNTRAALYTNCTQLPLADPRFRRAVAATRRTLESWSANCLNHSIQQESQPNQIFKGGPGREGQLSNYSRQRQCCCSVRRRAGPMNRRLRPLQSTPAQPRRGLARAARQHLRRAPRYAAARPAPLIAPTPTDAGGARPGDLGKRRLRGDARRRLGHLQ